LAGPGRRFFFYLAGLWFFSWLSRGGFVGGGIFSMKVVETFIGWGVKVLS
jgi:hypothetical protein